MRLPIGVPRIHWYLGCNIHVHNKDLHSWLAFCVAVHVMVIFNEFAEQPPEGGKIMGSDIMLVAQHDNLVLAQQFSQPASLRFAQSLNMDVGDFCAECV